MDTKTGRKATVTLTIDLDTYEAETGKALTEAELLKIGADINEDCAGIFGYESWDVAFNV